MPSLGRWCRRCRSATVKTRLLGLLDVAGVVEVIVFLLLLGEEVTIGDELLIKIRFRRDPHWGHGEAPSAAGVKTAKGARLAEFPDAADDAADGVECETAPALV